MGLFQEAVKGFVNGFASVAADNLRPSHAGVAAVERLCGELNWSVDDRVGETGIILHFRDPIAGIRPVLVTCGDNLAVISTFSGAKLHGSRVPAEVLGHLLMRNKELGTAAWQVSAADDGNATFATVYCALLGGLNAALFKYICETQVKEVHAFDAKMHKMQAAGLL